MDAGSYTRHSGLLRNKAHNEELPLVLLGPKNWNGRAVIPFPHSSGVSRWSNRPENKRKIEQAVGLLRIERERLGL